MRISRAITDAVLAANRKNSKHSTGPRTERGKSISRLNAFKHGFTAKTIAASLMRKRFESI